MRASSIGLLEFHLSRPLRLHGLILAVTCVVAAAPSAAQALTQTRTDPSDAPSGAFGKADLRILEWDVGGASAQLTVGVDASTDGASGRAQIGVHVLIDSDRDGIADHEVEATRNVDGFKVDLRLRDLDGTLSTSDCQDLTGVATVAQGTVNSTFSDGLEIFKFTFDPALAGGLAAFRWAAFAQAPPEGASAGPWDVMPEAANPDPGAANPGDRRCDSEHGGIRVRMNQGTAFPDDTPPPDTTAPQTTIETKRISQAKHKARFTFTSDEPTSTFECKLKGKGLKAKFKQFGSCTSPERYKHLDPGGYRFAVRATDPTGNTDPTPARDKFEIVG